MFLQPHCLRLLRQHLMRMRSPQMNGSVRVQAQMTCTESFLQTPAPDRRWVPTEPYLKLGSGIEIPRHVSTRSLYGVYSVDSHAGWAVSPAGNTFKTADGRDSWNHQYAGPEYPKAVHPANSPGRAVGNNGAMPVAPDARTPLVPNPSMGSSNLTDPAPASPHANHVPETAEGRHSCRGDVVCRHEGAGAAQR